jgi:hypothetical protein
MYQSRLVFLIFLLMTTMLLTGPSFANEAVKMTRVAEVTFGAVLIRKQESGVSKAYEYRFEKTKVEKFESAMAKSLGPDWSKIKSHEETFDSMRRSMLRTERLILDAYSVFINRKIPDRQIVIMVTNDDLKNDKFRTVFLSWKGAN